MFSRGSVSRPSRAADSDPLSAGASDAGGADSSPVMATRPQRSVSGRHERLQEMTPAAARPEQSGGFPSTGLSSKPSARGSPAQTPSGDATASLLPDGSLGRRAWQHFQAAPSAADLRSMIADSATGILVLSQAPHMGEEDLDVVLGDNILFTETPLPESDDATDGAKCKFTTVSGIYGTVDRGCIGALGVLPPMEELMHAANEADSPRATLFDVLDGEASVLQRLRIATIHQECRLPDGRSVQVAVVAGAPLEYRRVVDSAVSTLSARTRAAVESTYSALLPHAEQPLLASDPVLAALEAVMGFAFAAEQRSAQGTVVRGGAAALSWIARRPGADTTAERWQSCMRQLQDHVMDHLAALEDETSMCGDYESRRRIGAAVTECVEKLVTESVYVRIFALDDDRVQDERFASKVAALNVAGITLEHLGLAKSLDLQRICVAAGRILGRVDGVKSPAEKLKLIVDAHKCVVERVQTLNEQKRNSELAADCILPLLIYAVVKTNPPRLISNLRFVQRYRTQALLAAQFEYCMTNAQAAALFVESVDARNLGLDAEVSSGALERAMHPALSALHSLLASNVVGSVGMDVVQGVAGGGKKVAVGVFDATVGRLLDSSSQLLSRAPWRSLADKELQGVADGGDHGAISGVRDVLASASEQLSYEIKGHLPRGSPAPRARSAAPAVIDRFLDAEPDDIRVGDIPLLLKSYKELARHLRE
ncbi:hypothetical protein LPJ61_000854 [Coemansia biformis]|uniref:VPS9 domain-containing protein n=1 Tax=Coemansia biformis TaxID=1286918 RepID=A0A9W7YFY4_9FUNG|nr:hypothetical protein LPJ61_000854 [Coemansia biformis]